MAKDQLMAPIPSLTLAPGMQIRFEAIDPTTGAAVTGVKVSAIAISGSPSPVATRKREPLPLLLMATPDEPAADEPTAAELAAGQPPP